MFSLQAVVISLFAVLTVGSFVGIVRMRDGLDITDIVPRGTNEHAFLDAQSLYFGFYNFYAVTKVTVIQGSPASLKVLEFCFMNTTGTHVVGGAAQWLRCRSLAGGLSSTCARSVVDK